MYAFLDHGHGPPLLLLHGFTGSGESWEPLLPALCEHIRVLTVDLPGHGRTRVPDEVAAYSMPRVVETLAEMLVASNAAPAHVLGYSMGGRVALALAAHAPHLVQRLILESASPGLATHEERTPRDGTARIGVDDLLLERADGAAQLVEL